MSFGGRVHTHFATQLADMVQGKMPLGALGTLATQFIRGDRKAKKAAPSRVREVDEDSLSDPETPQYARERQTHHRPLDEPRRLADRPTSSTHGHRPHRNRHSWSSSSSASSSSSSSSGHASPRRYSRQALLPLPPPTRHALKTSRDSSTSRSDGPRRSETFASRAGARNDERDYYPARSDAGYTSEDASVDSYRSRNRRSSRLETAGWRRAVSRGRERF